jgi:hypothetical protein
MKLYRDPNGIRTRVTAVKGRCPRPLDDRVGERQISRRRCTLQAAFSRSVARRIDRMGEKLRRRLPCAELNGFRPSN